MLVDVTDAAHDHQSVVRQRLCDYVPERPIEVELGGVGRLVRAYVCESEGLLPLLQRNRWIFLFHQRGSHSFNTHRPFARSMPTQCIYSSRLLTTRKFGAALNAVRLRRFEGFGGRVRRGGSRLRIPRTRRQRGGRSCLRDFTLRTPHKPPARQQIPQHIE